MSQSRTAFLAQLGHYQHAIQDPALIDGPPNATRHNAAAKILRNGLCVAGFVILESFLRVRTGEIVGAVDPNRVLFSELPESLREAALLHASHALHTQANRARRRDEDGLVFIQNHVGAIASSTSPAFQLSPLLFAHVNSNLSTEEIKNFMAAVGIRDPWGSMARLGSRVGLGAPALRDAFWDSTHRRHASAHDPTASVTTSHLTNFAREALAVALGFDILVTLSVLHIQRKNPRLLAGEKAIDDQFVTIRTVQPDGTAFVHMLEHRTTAVGRDTDSGRLTAAAIIAGAATDNPVVIVGGNGLPADWHTPFFAP